jgi:hypothetical protein
MSQTVSQLKSLGTMPTRQVPIVQPLQVIKTPTDGVHERATQPYDNPNGSMGLQRSSVQTKIVHVALSLHLSFQLSSSHWGYMVGTTAGSRGMTMEALAPWPHHQIPQ